MGDESVWWDQQWAIPILEGRREAQRRLVMKEELVTEVPLVVNSPLSFQITEWERKMWKTYLGSVYRVREWSAASSKALVTANKQFSLLIGGTRREGLCLDDLG
jgi:hypothetical protein